MAVTHYIRSRILGGRHMRAVYVEVAKPPAGGDEPDDTE